MPSLHASRNHLVSKLKDLKHNLERDLGIIDEHDQEEDLGYAAISDVTLLQEGWKITAIEQNLPAGWKGSSEMFSWSQMAKSVGGHRNEDTNEVLGSSEFSTLGQDPTVEEIDKIQKVIKEFLTLAALVSDDRVIGADVDIQSPGGGQRSLQHQEQQHKAAKVMRKHDARLKTTVDADDGFLPPSDGGLVGLVACCEDLEVKPLSPDQVQTRNIISATFGQKRKSLKLAKSLSVC